MGEERIGQTEEEETLAHIREEEIKTLTHLRKIEPQPLPRVRDYTAVLGPRVVKAYVILIRKKM
jgi:hypothetical protein